MNDKETDSDKKKHPTSHLKWAAIIIIILIILIIIAVDHLYRSGQL